LACSGQHAEHGHDHGGGHADAEHGDHGGDEGESIAITRWTTSHELFVEFDAPVAGQAFSYHAHVTRLADNHAATSGALTIRFDRDGDVTASHADEAVARPGIFASQAAPPTQPGSYQLVFSYSDGDERAEWDAGAVQVGAAEGIPHEGEDEGEIAFLKETQWQVPFAVAPAIERPLAAAVRAAGVVRPAPGSTAVVAAPAAGLVVWSDALPVVGRVVRRGERLATLVPAGAAAHWATLHSDLATARIDRDQADAAVRRLERLDGGVLVSERRYDEARADLARAAERVLAAERRLGALTSGSAGAVSIRAPADGVVVAVGPAHGEAVSAGAPLVSVSADGAVLIEARVHTRTAGPLSPVASLSVQRGDWGGPKDLLAEGATVLTEHLVYDADTLSAPVSVRAPAGAGLSPGDLVELSIGVGADSPRLAIPRSAVVEINGQDVVFVQKTGESFARRRVALGAADATHVEITRGLDPGEMVVVEGGFDVHIASLSGALESHRH
jgi:RND family efflux transporter MFP subunit